MVFSGYFDFLLCVCGGAFMFTKVHLMPTLQWCVCLHTCEHITYYIKQFEPNWCWGNVIHKGVILLLSKNIPQKWKKHFRKNV